MTDQPDRLAVQYYSNLRAFEIGLVKNGQFVPPMWLFHLGEFLRSCGVDSETLADLMTETAKPRTELLDMTDWARMHLSALPERLDGRTVLDIGGFDGYVAFECLKRGASRAVVVDNMQYLAYTQPTFQHGWGRPQKYEGVEYVLGDLRDWSTWMDYVPLADLVICYNVIYHVAAPLDLLIALRALTRGEMLLATSYKQGDEEVWHFMPDASRTIFWTPTRPGLEKALRFVGFEPEWVAGDEREVIYRCIPR